MLVSLGGIIGNLSNLKQIKAEDILTHYEVAYPQGRKNDPFGLNVSEVVKRIYL